VATSTTLAPPLERQIVVQFRLATEADLPHLEWYGQYTHFRRVFQKTWREQAAGLRLMLLADLNGFPVGHIFILLNNAPGVTRKHQRQATDLRGYLYSLRVMAHLQGLGIGTQLVHCAENLLCQRGYDWAIISAAKTNVRARQLYERLGYRVYAEDGGNWQYVDHTGEIVEVHEPCWMLEKLLKTG
jgi:ribosomal protein S18 acetylase RimI-like enzyme